MTFLFGFFFRPVQQTERFYTSAKLTMAL